MQTLISPGSHNADPSRKQVSDSSLLDFFNSSSTNSENLTNDLAVPNTGGAASIDSDMLKLIKADHNNRNKIPGTKLINDINLFLPLGGSCYSNFNLLCYVVSLKYF